MAVVMEVVVMEVVVCISCRVGVYTVFVIEDGLLSRVGFGGRFCRLRGLLSMFQFGGYTLVRLVSMQISIYVLF